MSYYIGQSPDQYTTRKERYFYGLNRNDTTGMITLSKINLDNSAESVSIQNLSAMTGTKPTLENLNEGVDMFDGRNASHELVYDGLNYEQFKWDSDDLYYYIDSEGQLTVRINTPYNYAEGYTQIVLPEAIIITDPYDFGTITSTNPLENMIVADLGLVADNETTVYTIDAGTIV